MQVLLKLAETKKLELGMQMAEAKRQNQVEVELEEDEVHRHVHQHISGGGECPILRFPGEISYGCFTGCQKYFRHPVKFPNDVWPIFRLLNHIHFHHVDEARGAEELETGAAGRSPPAAGSSPGAAKGGEAGMDILRGETKGSKIKGKMGVKWDSRDGIWASTYSY